MKNKIIKKISGLFGYKLVEKDYIKNIRTLSTNFSLNIKNFLENLCRKKQLNSLIQIGANDGQSKKNWFMELAP